MRGMLITVILSFLLVLGMGIYFGMSSKNVSEAFIIYIEEAEAAIQEEEWEEALRLIRAIEKEWEKRSRVLSMWVNHGDVDDVSVGLAQLRISAEEKEKWGG